MSTDTIKDTPISCKVKFLHYLRLVIAKAAHFLFKLYYGDSKKKIPPITDNILKEPAIEVARKIRNKEVTSVEVLEACIRRIKDINPVLNCFVEDRFEKGLDEARKADELILSGTKSKAQLETELPFLGVPFTTKDCIGVRGLHQTAGVVMRKDFIAEKDADVIKLLRDKGAIVIGLTNVPELCMWWETHNLIYGRTNNPYDSRRIVGGSSGGEGCMQGAGGSIFGVGSDIGGSIRLPSFFNGIFGHKPSRKIVSNIGQYPIGETELHDSLLAVGPMTRHAVDLKPLLKIMSDKNCNKLNLDSAVDLTKIKVYYQLSNDAPLVDPVDSEIVEALREVVQHLSNKYKVSTEEKKIKCLQKTVPVWLYTMKSEKKFGQLIMEKDSILLTCIEIFKSIFGCSQNTLIALFTTLSDNSVDKIGSEKYKHYTAVRKNIEKTFVDMLSEDGVFLYPTMPTAAPYHNEPLIEPFNFSYCAIVNCLGLPSTAIPLGLNRQGLPIGIQVISNHNNDRLCLAIAEELDKEFGGWREPH